MYVMSLNTESSWLVKWAWGARETPWRPSEPCNPAAPSLRLICRVSQAASLCGWANGVERRQLQVPGTTAVFCVPMCVLNATLEFNGSKRVGYLRCSTIHTPESITLACVSVNSRHASMQVIVRLPGFCDVSLGRIICYAPHHHHTQPQLQKQKQCQTPPQSCT